VLLSEKTLLIVTGLVAMVLAIATWVMGVF
jgi:hypothetical protein